MDSSSISVMCSLILTGLLRSIHLGRYGVEIDEPSNHKVVTTNTLPLLHMMAHIPFEKAEYHQCLATNLLHYIQTTLFRMKSSKVYAGLE